MNLNLRNSLHYILILMMVIAPLRALQAMPSHCGDDGEMAMETAVMDALGVAPAAPAGETAEDLAAADAIPVQHDCCCCDGASACQTGCDMGVAPTLLLNEMVLRPVSLAITTLPELPTASFGRHPAPPVRPPLPVIL